MTVSPPHSLLVVPHYLAARLRYQAAKRNNVSRLASVAVKLREAMLRDAAG
jgi:hypothetical protein